MTGIKLLAGLGNVGAEYAHTRHNVGFWWVDAVAARQRATLKYEARFHGATACIQAYAHSVRLLEPHTFVNKSGLALSSLANYYRIAAQEILVIHDELDLQPGTIKLKLGGGHAGHNGLKDIFSHLGTPDFWRLRFGIGRPGTRGAVADYVLHPPASGEREALTQALDRGLQVLPLLVEGSFEAAALKLHTKVKNAAQSDSAAPDRP
ncbi:MAG: aminoacyl-tRNA hydrolase [Burkholderiales bacterium]